MERFKSSLHFNVHACLQRAAADTRFPLPQRGKILNANRKFNDKNMAYRRHTHSKTAARPEMGNYPENPHPNPLPQERE